MNKLLSFFLPKVLTETFKTFGFFLVICLVLKFAPISPSIFEMVTFVSFFGFPIVAYFSKKVYISASMDWILLTPVKKRDIIISNALLNLIKALLICFLLVVMYAVLIGFKLSSSEIMGVIISAPKLYQGDVDLPTSAFVFSTFLGLLVFAFLAGILPNYAQNLQQHQNHHIPSTLKEKLKSPKQIFGILGGVLMMSFIFLDGDVATIPAFIGYGIFLTTFLGIVVYSTLINVKYYFPKKPLLIGLAVLGLLTTVILHRSFIGDIENSKLSFDHRLEGLQNLGTFHSGAGEKVFADLREAPKKSRKLLSSDFQDLLLEQRFTQELDALQVNWETICSTRKDHSCRLSSYLLPPKKNFAVPTLLRMGCENDLRSCFELLKSHSPEPQEKTAIEAKMRTACLLKEHIGEGHCRGFRGTAKNPTSKPSVPAPAP